MLISIITVTYNSSKALTDTMQSVLNQDFPNIEHIIVDGASTDSTVEIIKQFEPLYDGRLRYISESDNGIYDAMNKGLSMANGDVIGFLNSDDFFTSNHVISQLISALEASQSDAVYGDVHYVEESDITRCVRYYSGARFRRWHMFFGFQPPHPSFYCRKEIYEKQGGFDTSFKVAGDFENLLRIIYLGRIKTTYVPTDCVTMRMGGASTSGMKSHMMIMRDHSHAYKKNHIHSNRFFDSLRYFYKAYELISQHV